MREHGLPMAGRVECGTEVVEAHRSSLAEGTASPS
jgi:hypothetical protein